MIKKIASNTLRVKAKSGSTMNIRDMVQKAAGNTGTPAPSVSTVSSSSLKTAAKSGK